MGFHRLERRLPRQHAFRQRQRGGERSKGLLCLFTPSLPLSLFGARLLIQRNINLGNDYQVKEQIKHRMFRSFDDVLDSVRKVVVDKTAISELVSVGAVGEA